MTGVARKALAVLAIGGLFGCGSPRPKSTAPASPEPAAAIDMITGSGTFPARRHLFDKATDTVTDQCVRAAGVPWSSRPAEPPAASDEDRILDLPGRRLHGYGIADAGNPDDPADSPRVASLLVGSPPRYGTLTIPGMAKYTFPVTGCLAEGRAAVAGDVSTWARISYLPAEIGRRLGRAVAADPRYLAAQRRWRQCMADRDLPYATPDDLRTHLARTRAPRAEEIRLAVQDAQCDHDVRLSLTGLALRRAAAATLDPGLRTEMARLSAAFDAAVGRAQALLSRSR